MKVLAQMNPDFWHEIFGTQDLSLGNQSVLRNRKLEPLKKNTSVAGFV
jgi:hypothetical protein